MLDQSRRLRKQKDFSRTYIKGKRKFGKYISLFFVRNNTDINRYGLVANKKVGKAVVRNRWRRRVRELLRELDTKLHKGYDVVVVAKPSMGEVEYGELKTDLARVLRKAGLFL